MMMGTVFGPPLHIGSIFSMDVEICSLAGFECLMLRTGVGDLLRNAASSGLLLQKTPSSPPLPKPL